jgi:drug/metabolite transporter (DMT)-like permease
VVAVVVGHFLGGEVLDIRTALGTALVLASVIVIATRRRSEPRAAELSSRRGVQG